MHRPIVPLSEEVIAKIAAGEVIERPSSVVKELIENSLDAKASKIEIDIEDGGRTLIRIHDDGIGMTPEEMRLAIKRHTTSKLHSADELFSLSTLGFRGEALASIAGVSRLTVSSRSKENQTTSGFLIKMDGGHTLEEKEIGHPFGTTFEIRDLFYNTPARLKFLKSDQTEWSHIENTIFTLGLGYPAVQWKARSQNRDKIQLLQKTLEGRIEEIFGASINDGFYSFEDKHDAIELYGYLSHPNLSRAQADQIYVFVNGRPIRDRLVNHAILKGYRSLLMKDQYPRLVLFLNIPKDWVDINVHPSKKEVRFAKGQFIHQWIAEAIEKRLADRPWTHSSKSSTTEEIKEEFFFQNQKDKNKSKSFTSEKNMGQTGEREGFQPLGSTPSWTNFIKETGDLLFNKGTDSKKEYQKPEIAEETSSLSDQKEQIWPRIGKTPFSDLELIGQLRRTYLVCQSENHLVLIDQHAAHERIGFETLRNAYKAGNIPSQRLLIPQIFSLKESELEVLRPQINSLRPLGFELEEFGDSTIAIQAIPALIDDQSIRALFDGLIRDFKRYGSSREIENHLDEIFASMACHQKIRAGEYLNNEEMRALLRQLDEEAYSYHCPHGRPVMVQISFQEIEKWFRRTV